MATCEGLVNILGNDLVDNNLKTVQLSKLLEQDYNSFALLFAGKWCSSSQLFVPQFINWYNELQVKFKNILIIFVSCDLNEQDFQSFFKLMPWYAIPFQERKKKQYLSRKYRVPQIPRLIYLDRCGVLTNKDGRVAMLVDPLGLLLPHNDTSIFKILSHCTILDKTGVLEDKSQLFGKKLGIYFSALWCTPCTKLTEALIKVYNKLKARKENFEIIFSSCDHSYSSFLENYKQMPWLALDFKKELTLPFSMFSGIQTIPTLILLDEDSYLINRDNHSNILMDPDGDNFPWPHKVVSEYSDTDILTLNDSLAFILACEDETLLPTSEILSLLEPIAGQQQYKFGTIGREHKILFYYVYKDSISEIERLVEVPTKFPTLFIIDVPFNATYKQVVENGILNSEVVNNFLHQFKEGLLSATPIPDF